MRAWTVATASLLGILAWATAASATKSRRIEVDSESPDDDPGSEDGDNPTGPSSSVSLADRWADDAPAPVDAPQLRNVEPRTRIYLDAGLAQTSDLSALPHIAGSGRNWRFAVGGSLRWRRFQFGLELPPSQATTVDLLDPDPGTMISPGDRHQTALSIGDLRADAQWTDALPIQTMPLAAGFSLRVRAPTHTTRFQFYNEFDGSTLTYALPYYFHVEPAVLLGGALGPVSFVMNQGALALVGPDARLGDILIVVPTLYFWDAHYALAWRVVQLLAVSAEVNTTWQLNHVQGLDFQKLNNVFALSVTPGLQWHVGQYRVDTVARFGLTSGAQLLGVVGYSGTRSFTVRVTRVFE